MSVADSFDHRRIDPVRQFGLPLGRPRQELIDRCAQLEAQLAALEAEMAERAARHAQLRQRLEQHRRRLFPNFGHRRGRAPSPEGREKLPPLAHQAVPLWGRRLRAVCTALLRASGALPLSALHALLHRHGYEVAVPHPVKGLADALAYEVEQGRARRVRRGVYEWNSTGEPGVSRRREAVGFPLAG